MDNEAHSAASDGAALCSVVIPAYNAAPYIEAAIASVFAQSYPTQEVIVVDDGSTDRTSDVVAAMKDPRLSLVAQENAGVSVARNRGLAAAHGEFVVFLDADDLMLPGAVDRFARALAERPDAVAVYGEGVVVDEAGKPVGSPGAPLFRKRPEGNVLADLLSCNFILTGGVFCARTAVVRQIGGFTPGLQVAEDWEFWCRMAAAGPFRYLGSSPVLKYRLSSGSVVRGRKDVAADVFRCMDMAFASPLIQKALSPEQLRRCRRRCNASTHSFAATQHLRRRDWPAARRSLFSSLRYQPMAVREWLLLALALLHCLPGCVEKRLK